MEHKSFASNFKNVTKQRPEIIKRVRYLCIRFLLILFLAISYCLFGGILFKSLEGDQEANYKCGKSVFLLRSFVLLRMINILIHFAVALYTVIIDPSNFEL